MSLTLRAQHATLLTLFRLSERYGSRRTLPRHLRTGLRGELEALFYLRRLGCTVVERRWRTPELSGDLDLIAWDGQTLCIVEVKTRSTRDLKPARSAVDSAKQRILIQMARAYLRTLPRETREQTLVRYDVVSIYLLGPLGNQTVECERTTAAFEDHFRSNGV